MVSQLEGVRRRWKQALAVYDSGLRQFLEGKQRHESRVGVEHGPALHGMPCGVHASNEWLTARADLNAGTTRPVSLAGGWRSATARCCGLEERSPEALGKEQEQENDGPQTQRRSLGRTLQAERRKGRGGRGAEGRAQGPEETAHTGRVCNSRRQRNHGRRNRRLPSWPRPAAQPARG